MSGKFQLAGPTVYALAPWRHFRRLHSDKMKFETAPLSQDLLSRVEGGRARGAACAGKRKSKK